MNKYCKKKKEKIEWEQKEWKKERNSNKSKLIIIWRSVAVTKYIDVIVWFH